MKKLLAILTVAATLFCFAGCGSKKSESGAGAYSSLSMLEGVELGVEEYGIAFRKGSDMIGKVDEITEELFQSGKIAEIAKKYELESSLVAEFKAADKAETASNSDFEYIKNKGTLVIGITNFDPMDYKDANGEWIGFDADYARAVCEKLGVKAEFKEIVWENKLMELDTKSIDCVWNGMTITDEVTIGADVTGAYIKNYQVVVVKDADKYTSLDSLSGKAVVAEAGSAGEAAAKEDKKLSKKYKAVESQADALMQVKSGQAEACVIDYVMAKSMLSK